MTYVTEDQAVEDSEPVELYRFVGPGSYEYHYTSSRTSQSYNGDTYTPLAISRDEVRITDITAMPDLIVRVPFTCQLVQDYFPTPLQSLAFYLYRRHGTSANVNTEWEGSVVDFSPSRELEVALRISSTSALALSQPFPRLRVQETCQHIFGDSRCGVDVPGSYTLSTTVSSVSSDGLTITVASVGSLSLKGGEIRRTSDGESRMIKNVSGTDVEIDFPFYEISATDAISLVAGCDRSAATCKDTYNNIANHGGMPYMPRLHPFLTKVR